MLTIHSKYDVTTDGRKTLMMRFERETPESDSPVVEVIYEVTDSEVSLFTDPVSVLVLLSATRTDTREPVTLTVNERRQVVQAAVAKLSER